MTDSLRRLFDANKPHREESDKTKVLVSLNASPDDSCLAALQEIGLTVKSVVGNKLTGEIRWAPVRVPRAWRAHLWPSLTTQPRLHGTLPDSSNWKAPNFP